ncbi:MAG TPA: DUF3341 domain-containing protein [Anaeromyxobacteraceae bacterium]|nr:DUF3341 domain-containing protein [Anaeromyxobacteraceae bacterium]
MSYVLAEFKDEQVLFAAARRLRELGHLSLDAHSPYPLHGAEEALGLKKSVVPLIGLIGALAGASTGYLMQFWMNGIDFAINVGNRLPHSPPTNIPITFELAVLFSAVSITIGLFALSGFPRTHHPVFEVESFRTATVDALWLSVKVKEEEAPGVEDELRRLGAKDVARVSEDTR